MEWEIDIMPTIPQEQIDEIQHEMAELLEQLDEALKRAEAAEIELRRIKAAYPELG